MLSSFGFYSALSLIFLVSGFGLTGYGVATKHSRNGLSFAIAGLPILGIGLGLMSIALIMPYR